MSDGRRPLPLSGEDGIKTKEACAVSATWVLACTRARVHACSVPLSAAALPCHDRAPGAMGGGTKRRQHHAMPPGPPSVPVPVQVRSAPAARGQPAAKHTPPDTRPRTAVRPGAHPPLALPPPAVLRAAARPSAPLCKDARRTSTVPRVAVATCSGLGQARAPARRSTSGPAVPMIPPPAPALSAGRAASGARRKKVCARRCRACAARTRTHTQRTRARAHARA